MTEAQILLRIVGTEKMQAICDEFGGERIYIPTRIPDTNRDTRILEVFASAREDGATVMSSYQQAAEEVGLSVRRVREIVAS